MPNNALGMLERSQKEERHGPVSPGARAFLASIGRSLTGKTVSQKLLLMVTSQLNVMLNSGCDLCAGLDSLAKQQTHPRLKQILEQMHEDVKQGSAFSQALGRHPEVFSSLYTTMVRAGESAGLLRHMLSALQIMIRNQMRIASSVRSAMMYPVILTLVAFVAIGVMTAFVLPRFALVFKQSNVPLPTSTAIVIGSAEFVGNHVLVIGLGMLAVVALLIWLLHIPSVSRKVQYWMLRAPLIGRTMRLSYCVRSIQTIGMLIKSGLPLADALTLTRDMMGNVYYWEFFDGLRTHISEGKTVATEFERTTLFPPMVTQMISVGEQTGTLAQVCLDISSFHEEELQERIKLMTTALEPIIIIFLGGFVGFIAVSVILPMFKLSSTVH